MSKNLHQATCMNERYQNFDIEGKVVTKLFQKTFYENITYRFSSIPLLHNCDYVSEHVAHYLKYTLKNSHMRFTLFSLLCIDNLNKNKITV